MFAFRLDGAGLDQGRGDKKWRLFQGEGTGYGKALKKEHGHFKNGKPEKLTTRVSRRVA